VLRRKSKTDAAAAFDERCGPATYHQAEPSALSSSGVGGHAVDLGSAQRPGGT